LINKIKILLICILGLVQLHGQNSIITDFNKIKFSGQASLYGSTYTTSDTSVGYSPGTYGISISTRLSNKFFSLPIGIRYANNTRSISYPYFRYGMAPKYKWAKVYLGNNNISFNRYAFTGLNVFGVGFEITPSIFYLGAFKGRFQKAVFIDSTNADYLRIYPRLKSSGYAVKAGIQTRAFGLLFTYANVIEEENSIAYYNPKYILNPRKSKTVGGELSLVFSRNISYNFYGGLSIFTRNTKATGIDTLLKNSGKEKLPSWAKTIEHDPNITTQLAFAHDHVLSYNSKLFYLNLRYKYIQPEYKTLSMGNINTDLSQISVEPGFKLLKQKLNFNLILGKQSNNLNNKLAVQNNNTIVNVNANYTPSDRFNVIIAFSNFGIVSNSVEQDQIDSFSLKNVNNNISLSSLYVLSKSNDIINTINLSASIQSLRELYEYNALYNKTFNNSSANIMYNHNENKVHAYFIGINYNNSYSQYLASQNIHGNVRNFGINGGYSKPLLKEKLNVNANASINLAGTAGGDLKPAYSAGLSASYAITKKTNFVLSFNFSAMTIANRNINQKYLNANITQNF
jgi:hypothetical protein